MKPLIAVVLPLCVLVLPVPAAGVSHDVVLHELSDDVLAGSLEFNAGATLSNITSVKLILRGTWTASRWVCPGFPFPGNPPGEDYVYGEIRDEGYSFAFVVYDLSGGFDREVTVELFYHRNWDALLDGAGIIDLFFELDAPAGTGYSCVLSDPGSLTVDEAILRFEADSIVPTEGLSWGALKAGYR